MSLLSPQIRLKALGCILRPVAKFCLKNSITIWEVIEVLKREMINVASAEIKKSSTKVNASRLSVLTGLYRRDINRILHQPANSEDSFSSDDTLSKVIGLWVADKRFQSKKGEPKILTVEGDDSEFHNLVKEVTKNINPGTVLFELLRSSRIERVGNKVKLIKQVFQAGEDIGKGFEHLERDLSVLINAVYENLTKRDDKTQSNLHFRTFYDNVYVKDIDEVKHWLVSQGRKAHREARAYLSSFDKDINPDLDDGSQAGAKITFISIGLAEMPELQDKAKEEESAATS